jgi:uncharacterized protein (TIGR02147 family)
MAVRRRAAHRPSVGRAAVDVFAHRDFRAFLRALYAARKATKAGFSLRAFSRRAGLRSPNYLKLVMDGERNLTSQMAVRFAAACGLEGEASEYFCHLVAFNQARTAKERELHYAQLKRFARYRKVHKLDAPYAAYHAHWYIPAIRELSMHAEFSDDPRWIAKTLLPSISPAQAKQALGVLLELGLLVPDPRSGRLKQAEPLLETPEGPLGHHVATFHRTMMALAAESIDRVPREHREIASLTLCLSEAQMFELKAELESIRRDLLQRYHSAADCERVVQVNLQMFPLSRKNED